MPRVSWSTCIWFHVIPEHYECRCSVVRITALYSLGYRFCLRPWEPLSLRKLLLVFLSFTLEVGDIKLICVMVAFFHVFLAEKEVFWYSTMPWVATRGKTRNGKRRNGRTSARRISLRRIERLEQYWKGVLLRVHWNSKSVLHATSRRSLLH
jgi:hypothetical protein